MRAHLGDLRAAAVALGFELGDGGRGRGGESATGPVLARDWGSLAGGRPRTAREREP
jgi:hypothetical protein